MSQKYILGHRAQRRSAAIRYTVTVGILLILAAVLQVSLLSRFRIFGAVPDLMIVTVLCIAFFNGRYMGAITGIAAGFLIESIGAEGIMILAICYLFFGYLVGHYAQAVRQNGFPYYLIFLGVALLYRAAITVFYACLNYNDVNLPQILVQSALPELFGTALAGVVLYFPIKCYCRLMEKKQ